MENRHKEVIMENLDILVERVQNYEDIMNQLLQRKIITIEMKNTLQFISNTEKDRKIELFKLLTKRGPETFQILLECFQETDNHDLAFLLKHSLSQGKSSEEISQDNRYILRREHPGRVLIINMASFLFPTVHESRDGSSKDVEDLTELFCSFGYNVTSKTNLEKNKFEKEVMDFISLYSDDCIILIIMSHGLQDIGERINIATHDNDYVNSNWIVEQFSSRRAPHLDGIPKLIFFSTCRSSSKEYTRSRSLLTYGDQSGYLETFADILIVYPCVVGSVSNRDDDEGSWFIQCLVKVFSEDARTTDVGAMLKKVGRRLEIICENNLVEPQKVCTLTIGFNKDLYIDPDA